MADTDDERVVDNAWHAVYSIESRHQIHGTQCLCGFQSHKARDRTKHIVRIALAEFMGTDVAEAVERLERGAR